MKRLAALFVLVPTLALAEEPAKEKPAKVELPTFGVSLAPPKGWIQFPEDSPGQVARFAKINEAGNPLAVVQLEIEIAGPRTLEGYVEEVNKRLAGTTEKAELAGIPGTAIVRKRVARPGPSRIVIVPKGKFFYVASAIDTEKDDVSKEFEAFRASIALQDFTPPAKHLEFRAEPVNMYGSLFRINVPKAIRPLGMSAGEFRLGLYSYVREKQDFIISFAVLDANPAKKPEDLLQELPKELAKRRLQAKPATLKEVGKNPSRWLGEAVTVETEPGGKKLAFTVRDGVVFLDKKVVLVTFSIFAPDANDAKALAEVCEKIMGSIEEGPKGPPAGEAKPAKKE